MLASGRCVLVGAFLFYIAISVLYTGFTCLVLTLSFDLFAPADLALRCLCMVGQVLSAYLLASATVHIQLFDANWHLADLFLTATPTASYIGFLAAAASLIIDASLELLLSPTSTPPPTEPIILLSISSFLIARYATKLSLKTN